MFFLESHALSLPSSGCPGHKLLSLFRKRLFLVLVVSLGRGSAAVLVEGAANSGQAGIGWVLSLVVSETSHIPEVFLFSHEAVDWLLSCL